MKIKNIVLLLILLISPMFLSIDNVSANESSSSSTISTIKENLSGDEAIKDELDSMSDDSREKLYNDLKENESLSIEEEIILEILEKKYAVDTWKIPTIILVFVVGILTLLFSVAETYEVPLLL